MIWLGGVIDTLIGWQVSKLYGASSQVRKISILSYGPVLQRLRKFSGAPNSLPVLRLTLPKHSLACKSVIPLGPQCSND